MSRSSQDEDNRKSTASTPSTKSQSDGDAEKQLHQADPSPESYKVDWDGENDPMSPRSLSAARKWMNVTVVAVGSLLVYDYFSLLVVDSLTMSRTCSSSIYVPCFEQLTEEFGSSEEVVTSGLSLFVFGLAVGPLLFGPLSEV